MEGAFRVVLVRVYECVCVAVVIVEHWMEPTRTNYTNNAKQKKTKTTSRRIDLCTIL
jgi:hypothetical protein